MAAGAQDAEQGDGVGIDALAFHPGEPRQGLLAALGQREPHDEGIPGVHVPRGHAGEDADAGVDPPALAVHVD